MLYESKNTSLEVKAVIEDIPQNTHFQFDLLTKLPDFGFGGLEYYTYLKLRPGVDPVVAIEKCNKLNTDLLNTRFGKYGAAFESITEPLTELHTGHPCRFRFERTCQQIQSDIHYRRDIFYFGSGSVEFYFVVHHQGEKRATEISVRKTNGAERKTIVGMLFAETTFVTSLAFVLAVVLYYSFAGMFAGLINFNMPQDVGVTGTMWTCFVLLFCAGFIDCGRLPGLLSFPFCSGGIASENGGKKV